jgi:hypothetical protein
MPLTWSHIPYHRQEWTPPQQPHGPSIRKARTAQKYAVDSFESIRYFYESTMSDLFVPVTFSC